MSTKHAKKDEQAPAAVVETPAVAAHTAPKAPKTKSVTFLRSHPAYAYWPGDKAEVEAGVAEKLIEGGFAH